MAAPNCAALSKAPAASVTVTRGDPRLEQHLDKAEVLGCLNPGQSRPTSVCSFPAV